ncbi:unnamed protein product [Discosporangium mesarthrocarpum]
MCSEQDHDGVAVSTMLKVGFRGKTLEVEVSEETTVGGLKATLESLVNVPVNNQKLIFMGKALRDDADLIPSTGILDADGGKKISHKPRLMLIGSTTVDVEKASTSPLLRSEVKDDFDGVAVPKGYRKVALTRAGPDQSPYRFERVETLPGLPEEDKARQILESLANDPGIRAVLKKHRWTVGCLAEMYPEGKVGVSQVCVMGLNQNHGMKILLRLRTDDLQGFRKILSIRKVLFHELAHNEFSDHDDNFYRLMRQVEKEVTDLDWRQQGGRTAGRQGRGGGHGANGDDEERTIGGGGGGGYILVREAFEGGSGRLGGASEGLSQIFSARELAGQAAILRLTPEEQEVEDGCGHNHGPSPLSAPLAGNAAPAPGPLEGEGSVAQTTVAVRGADEAGEGTRRFPQGQARAEERAGVFAGDGDGAGDLMDVDGREEEDEERVGGGEGELMLMLTSETPSKTCMRLLMGGRLRVRTGLLQTDQVWGEGRGNKLHPPL